MGESVSGECSSNKVATELTLRLLRLEPTMTRKVIFGIAAVLAVVVVAAVVAVLVSGKTEDEVPIRSTNQTQTQDFNESIALESWIYWTFWTYWRRWTWWTQGSYCWVHYHYHYHYYHYHYSTYSSRSFHADQQWLPWRGGDQGCKRIPEGRRLRHHRERCCRGEQDASNGNIGRGECVGRRVDIGRDLLRKAHYQSGEAK